MIASTTGCSASVQAATKSLDRQDRRSTSWWSLTQDISCYLAATSLPRTKAQRRRLSRNQRQRRQRHGRRSRTSTTSGRGTLLRKRIPICDYPRRTVSVPVGRDRQTPTSYYPPMYLYKRNHDRTPSCIYQSLRAEVRPLHGYSMTRALLDSER